jgi:hypothetical protein
MEILKGLLAFVGGSILCIVITVSASFLAQIMVYLIFASLIISPLCCLFKYVTNRI